MNRRPPPPRDLQGRERANSELEQESDMDSNLVEELTLRLPTSELVKIIKGALECGKRNVPFTESDLLRTMTFGTSSVHLRAVRELEPDAAAAGSRR